MTKHVVLNTVEADKALACIKDLQKTLSPKGRYAEEGWSEAAEECIHTLNKYGFEVK